MASSIIQNPNNISSWSSPALSTSSDIWTVYKVGIVKVMRCTSTLTTDKADGEVLFTLPTEYRSKTDTNFNFQIHSASGNYLGTIRINTDGTVTPVFGKLLAGTIRTTLAFI